MQLNLFIHLADPAGDLPAQADTLAAILRAELVMPRECFHAAVILALRQHQQLARIMLRSHTPQPGRQSHPMYADVRTTLINQHSRLTVAQLEQLLAFLQAGFTVPASTVDWCWALTYLCSHLH